ncbi:enoyl-CoA hydratase/isomerase family protein [Leifsonia poae]|uniref:enoyl-CoA hydratase/isomerase family protein n=1 Tax=Leifsonia poae TaxID=110933 RepID=UPI003D677F63
MTDVRLQSTGDGVSVLTLDGRGNAMDDGVFRELRAAADTVRQDGTRALILTGAGRVFCAGFDLALLPALRALSVPEFLDLEDRASGAIAAIHRLPFPVLAAVNGAAAGGGLSLALAADVRIASADATFSAAFARVGFSVGELGTSWMLSRLVGPGIAAELSFTGRSVDATEAMRIGLVNTVVDAALLQERTLELARTLAADREDGMAKRSILVDEEIASYEAAMLSRTVR